MPSLLPHPTHVFSCAGIAFCVISLSSERTLIVRFSFPSQCQRSAAQRGLGFRAIDVKALPGRKRSSTQVYPPFAVKNQSSTMRPLAYSRGLIAASFLALHLLASTAHVQAAGPSIMSTSIISTSQVDSTTFDYTIQAVLYNPGPDLVGATAIVTTDSPNTEILDGSVTFGRVASGGTAYSLDTFTIRQDRSASFNPQWQVISIEDVSPSVSNFPPAQGDNNPRSVSGKVLSLAVARDDRTVYAGTFSGRVAL